MSELQWVEKNLSLAKLKSYERNPCQITDEQYEKLKEPLRGLGYNSQILVTHDNRVIGGHQRLWAIKDIAQEAGIKVRDVEVPWSFMFFSFVPPFQSLVCGTMEHKSWL